MTRSSEFPQAQIDDVRRVLQRASVALQAEYERISGGCIAMTTGDKTLLKIVAETPDIILRELRQILRIPNSTLTSAVDRLEKRGLVRRKITKRDRRSYGLELTAGGRAYMALQNQAEEDLARRILRILGTEQEREAFVEILSKVVDRLGQEEATDEGRASGGRNERKDGKN